MRRSRVRAGLLAAIAVVVAAATVLISVVLGVVQRGTTDGVRGYLADRSGSSTVLSFATTPGPDPVAQTTAARALVDGLFGDLPVDLFHRTFSARSTITAGLPEQPDGGQPVRLAGFTGAEQHATLLGGRWPTDSGSSAQVEAALPADVAERLGVQVGARLVVGADSSGTGAARGRTVALTVSGVFRPDGSGFWSASRALVQGVGVTDSAPVFQVVPQVLAEGGAVAAFGGVLTGWTLVPRIDEVAADQVAALRSAVGALPAAVRADEVVNVGGTLFAGGLQESLEATAAAVGRAAAAAPLPLVLVALFCLVMLVQLGRLLTDDRRPETVLLLSRGLSVARASWWAALETLVVALLGAAVGSAVAAGGPGLVGGGLLAAACAVVAATVAATVPAHREAAAPLVRDRTDDSGRGRVLVAGGAVLLVTAAAVFAWWRFRISAGTPTGAVEPAVLLAPAVILLAGGLVATVVFGAVAALLARVLPGRDTGIGLSLPVRGIARRATVFASIVLLGSLSVGSALLAASYSGTVTALERSAERLRLGPDVRIDGLPVADQATDRVVLHQIEQLPGVLATSPVLSLVAPDDDSSRTLVGLRAAQLPALSDPVGGTDPVAIAAALPGPAEFGVALPEGTVELRIAGRLTGLARTAGVEVGLWWATVDGLVVQQAVAAQQGPALALRAPAPTAGSRLLAVDLQIDGADGAVTVEGSVSVTAADGSGAEIGTDLLPGNASGVLVGAGSDGDAVEGSAAALRVRVVPEGVRIRLLAPGAATGSAPIDGVVAARTAERSGLAVGDVITLSPPGVSIQVRISAVVPVIPGFDDTDAVLTDLSILQRQLLSTAVTVPGAEQVWIGSSSPAVTAAAAAGLFGDGVQVEAIGSSAALTAPAVTAYRWGTIGSLALAIAGVAVVAVTLAHRRRSELVVLSALGVRPARQGALRRRELGVTVVVGWVLGCVLGWLTVNAVIPRLAVRSVVGGQDVPAPGLTVDGSSLAWQLGGHAVGVLAVVLLSGLQVRRAAVAGDPRWVTP